MPIIKYPRLLTHHSPLRRDDNLVAHRQSRDNSAGRGHTLDRRGA